MYGSYASNRGIWGWGWGWGWGAGRGLCTHSTVRGPTINKQAVRYLRLRYNLKRYYVKITFLLLLPFLYGNYTVNCLVVSV